jgi:hypothetical protein
MGQWGGQAPAPEKDLGMSLCNRAGGHVRLCPWPPMGLP